MSCHSRHSTVKQRRCPDVGSKPSEAERNLVLLSESSPARLILWEGRGDLRQPWLSGTDGAEVLAPDKHLLAALSCIVGPMLSRKRHSCRFDPVTGSRTGDSDSSYILFGGVATSALVRSRGRVCGRGCLSVDSTTYCVLCMLWLSVGSGLKAAHLLPRSEVQEQRRYRPRTTGLTHRVIGCASIPCCGLKSGLSEEL